MPSPEIMPFRVGYIAIVGRPNVGKSTLLNHLIGEKISITSRKAQTTRHRVVGIRTDEEAQYIFVDTPGFQLSYRNALNRVMNQSVTQALADVDVVLFVIEACRFDDRDAQVAKLLPRDRPLILVMNKIDQLEDKRRLLPFTQQLSTRFSFSAIVPVSAEKGQQLPELLEEIRQKLPEGAPMFEKDAITDRSERFLAAEIVREKVFRLLGEEVPYGIAVEIERFTIEGRMRRIQAAIIADRPGQKAIIIGQRGEKIKRIGSDARQDMERLFDGKVHLELWVKVRSGWADSARAVKSLGYE